MKVGSFLRFASFGLSTIVFRRKKPILATIILTDRCNLHCKHCAVNNITSTLQPYCDIRRDMMQLYARGIRILFFCGGETFLWQDDGKTLRDLVIEAKQIGFSIVNVVTNGTFALDLPEADLILLSLDGAKEAHNAIRGDTYEAILRNIGNATKANICLYMAVNALNQGDIESVAQVARDQTNVKAVSFNFHTPYPGTEALSLSREQKRQCCDRIERLMDNGYPIFNLRSAFPALCSNAFPTPCRQCLVLEGGKEYVCGRCVEIDGLCDQCGYFFAAEYALLFGGNLRVAFDMMRTYLKYI